MTRRPEVRSRIRDVFSLLLTLVLASTLALAACDDSTNPEDGDAGADATSDGESSDTGLTDTTPDAPDTRQTDVGQDTRDTRLPDTGQPDTISPDAADSFEVSTDELILTSVQPTTGPSAGQNRVTLDGQGFTPDMDVFFAGARVLGFEYESDVRVHVVAPPGTAGPADVKAVNANGNSTLADGYTYVDPIVIDDITPDRSPVQGGLPFVLTGSGFTDNATISIAGRAAIDVIVESESRATGITPPAAAGPQDVRVTSEGGSTLAEGIIDYYVPATVDRIFPAAGPIAGGTTVTLTGSGFDGQVTVTFGTREATLQTTSSTEIVVTSPAVAQAGARDVVVTTDNGTVTVDDGFHYFEPGADVEVLGIRPAFGPTTGGNEVVIAGQNFDDGNNLDATIGGTSLTSIDEVTATSIRGVAPAGTLGLADVEVTHDQGSDIATGIYEYLGPLTIDSVTPSEGPVTGGTTVTVTGEGFDATTSVLFGPLAANGVNVISSTELEVVTPSGSGGYVDVTVEKGPQTAVLEDGFLYRDSLGVFGLSPQRGSQAGNTLVTLAGKGFAPDAEVYVDGTLAPVITVLDPATIQFRTPPHAPDVVDVEVRQGGDTATSPIQFTYYDPTSLFGGGWGDPIEGTVNVTVLQFPDGAVVPGAFVMLSTDTGTPHQGLTDQNGQITFSGDGVYGTQTITASKEEYSSATVETIDAENVTIFINSLMQSNGEPPPGVAPGIISGDISGAEKVALVADPNKIRLSIVVTSQISPFRSNPDPGTENQVQGGNGFYRLISRLGDIAVIGMCGLYDTQTETFEPKYMAIERFIRVTEGSEHQIDLQCSIRLDQVMTFKLVDGPLDEEPNGNLVIPYLKLGPEGYFGGYAVAEGTTETVATANQAPLEGPLANMSYYLIGGSFTDDTTPYSLAQFDDVTDFSNTIEFGPLLALPQLTAPLPNGQVTGNYVEWTMKHPQRVDMYSVSIVEPTFPPTPIWDVYLPGSATSFKLPEFLPGAGAAEPYTGLALLQFEALRMDRAFDFDNFTLTDLDFSGREAWAFKSVPVTFP